MTSKEALEELKFQVGNITYFTHDLQMTTYKVRDSGLFEIIGKDLEVLDLLKKKYVDVRYLKYSIERFKGEALSQYNKWQPYSNQLTKEEFNLLKEWMERC